MPNTEDAAHHYGLSADTVRRHIKDGKLDAQKLRRDYRMTWEDIWAAECGPFPRGSWRTRYQTPLITKKHLMRALEVDLSTIDRWIADGLPSRKVFRSWRCNAHDVSDWLRLVFGYEIAPETLLAQRGSHKDTGQIASRAGKVSAPHNRPQT